MKKKKKKRKKKDISTICQTLQISDPWLIVCWVVEDDSRRKNKTVNSRWTRRVSNARLEKHYLSSRSEERKNSAQPYQKPSSSSARVLLCPMTTPNSLWRNPLLLDKQVDQRLHGLHLLVRNKLVVLGDSHKVHKRHVKNVMFVDMPERV